jgi:UDP-N-acetylglucosamine acyltransferase
MTRIHPTAVIDSGAELAADVEIGPYAIVRAGVRLGAGCHVASHAVLEGDTTLGAGCEVGIGAVIGAAPQDRKYAGEPTRVEVGADTVIREYATIHRGTSARGCTSVGAGCYLMAYAHVAHDCVVEDDVTIANAVQLAGHVTVERGASIGGLTPVHQFVRIGRLAFVGGGSRVPQDVPPFARAAGNPIKLFGLNTVGLERAGVPADTRRSLKRAYRLIFNSSLRPSQATETVRQELGHIPEVAELIEFLAQSERGVMV